MRRSALEVLRCPECAGCLTLRAFDETSEVEEGMLTCDFCDRTFPIINAIPRLLPDVYIHVVVQYHADFFRRWQLDPDSFIDRSSKPARTRWLSAERRTIRSYSYQWRKFKEMYPHWEQVFLDSIRPITPSFFPGKRGLDAGCGFGRSLRYAASYGAEMFGLDLSEAIEAARDNTRHLPNVHLVQGDIFHPPLAPAVLDFVYSIGVLHHLPDPKAGFLTLTRLLKPDAPIFIWVYLRHRGRQIAAFSLMRAISTRVPLRFLNVACLAIATGQWLAWILPYRILHRFRATRRLARHIPFTLYAQYPFRVLHTDWFDGLSVPLVNYYRREHVEAWYREAGLERVRIDEDWRGRALGYAPQEPGNLS
ncbi:MAG: methyltransferase domain-containing protein [Acidobacteriota bacterium]|nr:methyltransferase domain-containing protein [Acidobacteriota bacterium]